MRSISSAMRRNVVKGPPLHVLGDRAGLRRPSRAGVIAVSLSAICSPPDVFSDRTVCTNLPAASKRCAPQAASCAANIRSRKIFESDDQGGCNLCSRDTQTLWVNDQTRTQMSGRPKELAPWLELFRTRDARRGGSGRAHHCVRVIRRASSRDQFVMTRIDEGAVPSPASRIIRNRFPDGSS
jgi:hypothetical protein